MTTRITNKDRFNEVIAMAEAAGNTALADWARERIVQLDKRNTAERKPSKEQIANDGYRTAIVQAMEPGTKYSLSEIAAKVPGLEGSTSQRMVGLIRLVTNDPDKGVTDRPINKVMDGRKTLYELA